MSSDTLNVEFSSIQAGQSVRMSNWHEIDQGLIGEFARTTKDPQKIHLDMVSANAAGFSCTIAHGFLTLSLLSIMAIEALPALQDQKLGINFGFNKVRFLEPVPCGVRVRGKFQLKDVRPLEKGLLQTYFVIVEIEKHTKPALIAEWLLMAICRGS